LTGDTGATRDAERRRPTPRPAEYQDVTPRLLTDVRRMHLQCFHIPYSMLPVAQLRQTLWNPDWVNDTLRRSIRKNGPPLGRRGTLPDAMPLVRLHQSCSPHPRGLHRPKQCQDFLLVLRCSSPEGSEAVGSLGCLLAPSQSPPVPSWRAESLPLPSGASTHSSQLPSTDDDRTQEKRACPSAPALSLSCSRTNTD
jgi:hypothetical protein